MFIVGGLPTLQRIIIRVSTLSCLLLSLYLQVMERFNVDIRFPKDKDSSIVVIQGLEENVEDAKEHLITLAEDYVSKEQKQI